LATDMPAGQSMAL